MSANEINEPNETIGAAVPAPDDAPIVVGLDASPSAAAGLRWAAEQSQATGRALRVVYAWQLMPLRAPAAAAGPARFREAATADARARATRWVLDTLGGTAADVRWTLDIVEGAPGAVLVSRSRGAWMLVLGTREHTGLRRAVLGSVSHYCLSRADLPVVAVPAPRETAPGRGPGAEVLATPGPLL